MSKCAFSVGFSGPANQLEQKLATEIQAYGGTVDTTARSLNIKIPVVGTISGNYRFEEQTMHIEITAKPMLLSCDQIEKQVTQFLGKQ